MQCWAAEKETVKSLVESLPEIEDREPLLGYHFIINDWFQDEQKGRAYADWAFASMQTVLS